MVEIVKVDARRPCYKMGVCLGIDDVAGPVMDAIEGSERLEVLAIADLIREDDGYTATVRYMLPEGEEYQRSTEADIVEVLRRVLEGQKVDVVVDIRAPGAARLIFVRFRGG